MALRVLAFNCGSSSIKCAVIDTGSGARLVELGVNLGDAGAVDAVLAELRAHWPALGQLDAVVHRVVHGGERFTAPTRIDDEMLARLGELEQLAPLHNPIAMRAIRGTRELFADLPQVAVFDTAFHATLPPSAREYAVPADLRARFGLRRYGFHGISHADVAVRAAAYLQKPPQALRILSCHLGGGASVTAIENGRSVETSMGMTPLEGLVMGTRAGDLDPGVVLTLGREFAPEALSKLLNKGCGMTGMTGTSDMRLIERRASEGDEDCRLALGLYIHRIRKYLGAYAAVMGGVDAITFTGGVGEHSVLVRHLCLQRLGFLGATLDEERNRDIHVSAGSPVVDIATSDSPVRILLIRADEERAMADAVETLTRSETNTAG